VKRDQKRYDWAGISAYYEDGHSPSECQREFAISNGAWYAAVQRGTIVLRDPGRPRPRTHTREEVARLHEAGASQAEIARALAVSAPTVCFHLRNLGVEARPEAARRYDWQEICDYYAAGHSAAECRRRFGFGVNAWADAIRRGVIRPRPRLEPLEHVLAAGRAALAPARQSAPAHHGGAQAGAL
jgi:DNA-binding CsgD family transcriptional regulator